MKKNFLYKVGLAVSVCFLFGISASAATNYDSDLSKVLTAMKSVKSAKFSFQGLNSGRTTSAYPVSYQSKKLSNATTNESSFNIGFDGLFEGTGDNLNSEATVVAQIKSSGSGMSLIPTVKIKADFKSLGMKALYLKLVEAPFVGSSMMLTDPNSLGLAKYVNKWLVLDYDELKREYPEVKKAYEENNTSQLAKSNTLSRFYDLLQKNKVIKITSKTAGGKIGSIDTTNYKFTIDNAAQLRFYLAMAKDFQGKTMTNSEVKMLAEDIKQLGPINGDIWVGTNDNLIYRFKTRGTIKKEERQYGYYLSLNKYDLTLSLSDHNNPANKVIVPVQAESVIKIFKEWQKKMK
ncbi:MAG: hypothetical protein WCO03_01730 [bacterium]